MNKGRNSARTILAQGLELQLRPNGQCDAAGPSPRRVARCAQSPSTVHARWPVTAQTGRCSGGGGMSTSGGCGVSIISCYRIHIITCESGCNLGL
jgi:hypothetical protein